MAELDLNNKKNIPNSSKIKAAGLSNFLSTLFGFRRSKLGGNKIEMVNVDLGSNERVGQALLNDMNVTNIHMSSKLDYLFDRWLTDTTDKYEEVIQREYRLNQIRYLALNDPYIGATISLYADEATQLDDQDTLINIETPDPMMTKTMYSLLNRWGITQTRVRSTIEQLATYGDAFWANKITENGVESVKILKQGDVTDRIEFNPAQVLEKRNKKEGGFSSLASNNYLIDQMLNNMDLTDDFADIFDTKLFGFQIEKDLVVPPWRITHFRVGADSSEYAPWGTSPLLGALSPSRQTQATIALQSVARELSFPVTIFSVKTSDQMDEARQFAVVNKVRESYDNIGVSPAAGGSENYTINTKIWVPENLLKVEVKDSKVETQNVEDIKIYQDREALALGLPKSFFGDQGWWSGVKASGRALVQQFKPFGRKVFSIQNSFLEGLADLFRIHFAITGEYDFRIPFTLSMRYPAEDVSEDKDRARGSSMDLASKIVDIVRLSIGAEKDENLPPEVIRDIISKYTFIDPSDLMKWAKTSSFKINADRLNNLKTKGDSHKDDFDRDYDSDYDYDSPEDLEDIDLDTEGEDFTEAPSDSEAIESAVEESKKAVKDRLREARLKEEYELQKDEIYFKILKESAINNFVKDNSHVEVFNQIPSSIDLMLETLANSDNRKGGRLKEKKAPSKRGKKKEAESPEKLVEFKDCLN